MNQSIKELLEQSENIAIIGCSGKPERTSCKIAKYLKENGYNIIPIHPDYDEIHGEKVYPTVYDVPGDIEIDIVDIFRNSKYTANMVDDIIKRVEQSGRKPVVWTQLGVSSEEAKKKAEQAGLTYVENRCIMVDHRTMIS